MPGRNARVSKNRRNKPWGGDALFSRLTKLFRFEHAQGKPFTAPETSRVILDACTSGLVVTNADGHTLYANRQAVRWLFPNADDLNSTSFSRAWSLDAVEEIDVYVEGAALTLEARTTEISWNGGHEHLVTLTDVTERQRLRRLKAERVRVLERMAHGASLDEMLSAVVRFVESQFPASICTVMLLDESGRYLRHGASIRFPEALIKAFEGAEIGASRGSCGTAAAEARTVIVTDIANDPLWVVWRELALSQGMRSCWSVPIFSSSGRVVATFANYRQDPHAPNPDELDLAGACAHIVGIAIDRQQAEEQLRLLQTSVRYLNDLIVITEAEPLSQPGPRILFVNEAFTRRTGYTSDDVLGKTPRMLQGPLTQRIELDRIRAALEAWQPVRAELINYTKSGESFWLQLDIVPVADATGWYTHWVSVERDITDAKRSQFQALHAAEMQELIIRTQREIAEAQGGIDDVMKLLTQRAMELTGAEGGALLREEDGLFIYSAVAGIAEPHLGLQLASERSLALEAASTGEPQICHDAELDAWVDPDACRAIGVRSVLCAPLIARGRVIAVLSVLSSQPSAFQTNDAVNLRILLESLGAVVQREQAAETVRASEERYRLLFNHNPHPMWVYDRASMAILSVNDAAVEHYGYSRSEFLSMRITQLRPTEEVGRLANLISRAPPGRIHAGLWKHRLKNGDVVDVEVSSDDITLDGRSARLVLASDVSQRVCAERDLQRVARAQRLLSRCNEALMRADNEQALLDAVCRIVVVEGGYRMAWVGYAIDDDTKSVVPMACAGEGIQYLDGIQISWADDHPSGQGASGRTIRQCVPVVVPDIAIEPGYSPWLDAAKRHGFRSTCSLPLLSGDHAYGHLTMYATEPLAIAADELELLLELADNLAYGIGSLRASEERRRMNAAVTRIATSMSMGAGRGLFEEMARAMIEAVAADAAFIARLLPGDPSTAQTLVAIVDGQVVPNFDYALEGTPCEALRYVDKRTVADQLAEQFPGSATLNQLRARAYVGRRMDGSDGTPLGMIFVIFRQPLKNSEFVDSALEIFAARGVAILERQRADKQLYEQASLLDKAQDGIVVRDLNQRITYWNKGAERIYGWSFEEVRGQLHVEPMYFDPDLFGVIIENVYQEGEWNGRAQQRRKDGRPLTVDVHATLIRDEHGLPQSSFAIVTDITHRLALEERIQQSERLEMVGQLTGGVAHDFNNLLTVMLGNAEMLAEDLRDQPRLYTLAEMTLAAAQRGTELTHRLLAFARRQPLDPKVVQVNALIKGMDPILRRTLGNDLELEFIQGAGLWEATIDSAQLEGALLNLCLNARDAMVQGGQLTIETANASIDEAYASQDVEVEVGQYVLIAVSDTGSGIAPENVVRVFEPFFTTKEAGRGTGLGMSMVYGFVKQSRGHIKIYSELGFGTTIKMYLPRALYPAHPVAPSVTSSMPRGRATILIVEDDEMVRRFVEEQLRGLGYQTMTARNGSEALEIVRGSANIDLLFTDVVMPGGMNGRQLSDAALSLRPTLRVLFTSGYTKNTVIHRGQLDPDVRLLSKPYTRADLAEKIRAVLSQEL